MKIHVSTCSPQVIEPLSSVFIDERVVKARKSLAKPTAVFIENYNGHSLWRYGSKNTGGYALLEGSESKETRIIYLVNYREIRLPADILGLRSSIRQVLVWHDYEAAVGSAGIALHVVLKYLIPEYKLIISDELQTARGRNFWVWLVKEALESKLRVRVFNKRDHKSKEIESNAALVALDSTIWGKQYWFRDVLLAVSVD